MTHFESAFSTWLNNHPNVSLRSLSQDSGVDSSMLSLIRKGSRSITFEAISKLLPSIERQSSRPAAVTLLIAYLTDETPSTHADAISIQPINVAGKLSADTYSSLAQRWEAKARIDPEFMSMWQGMDLYMHSPEEILHTRSESDIALLAESPIEYKFTPKLTSKFTSGHPQDNSRLDPMPSQHVAQEHEEP